MKKLGKLFLILFTISTVCTSCRNTKTADDVADDIEDVGDDIGDALD